MNLMVAPSLRSTSPSPQKKDSKSNVCYLRKVPSQHFYLAKAFTFCQGWECIQGQPFKTACFVFPKQNQFSVQLFRNDDSSFHLAESAQICLLLRGLRSVSFLCENHHEFVFSITFLLINHLQCFMSDFFNLKDWEPVEEIINSLPFTVNTDVNVSL